MMKMQSFQALLGSCLTYLPCLTAQDLNFQRISSPLRSCTTGRCRFISMLRDRQTLQCFLKNSIPSVVSELFEGCFMTCAPKLKTIMIASYARASLHVAHSIPPGPFLEFSSSTQLPLPFSLSLSLSLFSLNSLLCNTKFSHLGTKFSNLVKQKILQDYAGQVPVGEAFMVRRKELYVVFVILGRYYPRYFHQDYVYQAFRAALIKVRQHNVRLLRQCYSQGSRDFPFSRQYLDKLYSTDKTSTATETINTPTTTESEDGREAVENEFMSSDSNPTTASQSPRSWDNTPQTSPRSIFKDHLESPQPKVPSPFPLRKVSLLCPSSTPPTPENSAKNSMLLSQELEMGHAVEGQKTSKEF